MHVFCIVQTYSGTPGKVSPVVVLPPAVERGLCSQSISRKHDNGNFLIDWICLSLQTSELFPVFALGALLCCGYVLQQWQSAWLLLINAS